jgi:diguanylate cyclase (GGDEF)-like protein
MAEAETLGLLHIQLDAARPLPDDHEEGRRRSRLALAVAEHAALGLANIRLRETLREQAIRDPLTGLYNRRYLEATLERELRRAARNRHPVGIIVLDIDHFKHYNDTYGHDAGDTVLRALGIFLLGSVRADDIVCRYGGEEFVLVLPSAPQAAALARAEQICRGVRALRVSHQERSLGPITVSLGITTMPEDELSFAAALARADAALYAAKRGGRDRAVLHSHEDATPS